MRWMRFFVSIAAAAGIEACGGEGQPADRYALEASGGTYNDGSGLLGVATLATLRDNSPPGGTAERFKKAAPPEPAQWGD